MTSRTGHCATSTDAKASERSAVPGTLRRGTVDAWPDSSTRRSPRSTATSTTRTGGFDWAAPDVEVHAFVNDLERDVGTYLCGRRLYETMVYWETAPTDGPTGGPGRSDYARIWQAADKVVYSRTLEAVSSERTTLERDFDPAAVGPVRRRGRARRQHRWPDAGGRGAAGRHRRRAAPADGARRRRWRHAKPAGRHTPRPRSCRVTAASRAARRTRGMPSGGDRALRCPCARGPGSPVTSELPGEASSATRPSRRVCRNSTRRSASVPAMTRRKSTWSRT